MNEQNNNTENRPVPNVAWGQGQVKQKRQQHRRREKQMQKKENKRMLMDRPAGEATSTPAGARETGRTDPSQINAESI
jgi:hypothetical protein